MKESEELFLICKDFENCFTPLDKRRKHITNHHQEFQLLCQPL